MQYGFSMPNRGPLAEPDAHRVLAGRAEALGFGFITVSDHLVIPDAIGSTYPYSPKGDFPGSSNPESLEQLGLMAFLAGITERVRILSSVMVVPHRSPILAAKTLATIDILSKGRLTVGCGVGWMREEFEALGVPAFDERGRVSDEYIDVFKAVWTQDKPTFNGRYVSFANASTLPHPVQKPHPPIWIGGESPAAIRRAATRGDAWYPFASNPKFLLDTPQRFAAAVERLHAAAEKIGRDPATIGLALSVPWYDETEQRVDGARRLYTGAPADVAADISSYGTLGVRHLLPGLAAPSLAAAQERMERFMTEVAPLVR
jgi:probable F420-dependent oxidoreductase